MRNTLEIMALLRCLTLELMNMQTMYLQHLVGVNYKKNGLYGDFINYANTLARIIKDAGMKPLSFNDGIYYNHKDDFGTFDKHIVISYWTSGWWGFNVAKPEYFANNGHDLLNTNDAWY